MPSVPRANANNRSAGIADEYSAILGVGVGVTPGANTVLAVGMKNACIAISLAGIITLTVLEV